MHSSKVTACHLCALCASVANPLDLKATKDHSERIKKSPEVSASRRNATPTAKTSDLGPLDFGLAPSGLFHLFPPCEFTDADMRSATPHSSPPARHHRPPLSALCLCGQSADLKAGKSLRKSPEVSANRGETSSFRPFLTLNVQNMSENEKSSRITKPATSNQQPVRPPPAKFLCAPAGFMLLYGPK